jgi:hypothetical protein
MQNLILVQYPLSIPPFPVFIKLKRSNSMAPPPEFPLVKHKFFCGVKPDKPRKEFWEVPFTYFSGSREQRAKLKVREHTVEEVPTKREAELFLEIMDGTIGLGDEVLITGTIVFEAFKFKTSDIVYSPTLRITEYEHGRKAKSISDVVRFQVIARQ